MPRVPEHIYYRPKKVINPFYIQIGENKTSRLYYRSVFATFEEAVKARDEYLAEYN